MRAVIQRVKKASVIVAGKEVGAIQQGLLILLGVETEDTLIDVEWLANKILKLRIFSDADKPMHASVQDIKGGLLVVSQFTLHAAVQKGNRPSFIKAARPEMAEPLYEAFVQTLRKLTQLPVATGIFGAMMDVNLCNDGPVTIFIDTKAKQ